MACCRLFYCLKSVESIEWQLTIATAFGSNRFYMVRSFRMLAMSIIQLAIFQFSNCWLQCALCMCIVHAKCKSTIEPLDFIPFIDLQQAIS